MSLGLICRKKQLCMWKHSFLFLCHCFAWLQSDTSSSRNFLVTRFMQEMSYVYCLLFFSLILIFIQVAISISHLLTATIKFPYFCSNEIGLLCFYIVSHCSSSFSVIHLSVDIKIQLKERPGFVVVFFLSKSPGWTCDLLLKRAGA